MKFMYIYTYSIQTSSLHNLQLTWGCLTFGTCCSCCLWERYHFQSLKALEALQSLDVKSAALETRWQQYLLSTTLLQHQCPTLSPQCLRSQHYRLVATWSLWCQDHILQTAHTFLILGGSYKTHPHCSSLCNTELTPICYGSSHVKNILFRLFIGVPLAVIWQLPLWYGFRDAMKFSCEISCVQQGIKLKLYYRLLLFPSSGSDDLSEILEFYSVLKRLIYWGALLHTAIARPSYLTSELNKLFLRCVDNVHVSFMGHDWL